MPPYVTSRYMKRRPHVATGPGPWASPTLDPREREQVRGQGLMALGSSLLRGVSSGDYMGAIGQGLNTSTQIMQGLSDQIISRKTQEARWNYQMEQDQLQTARADKQEVRAIASDKRAQEAHDWTTEHRESPAEREARLRKESYDRAKGRFDTLREAKTIDDAKYLDYLSLAESVGGEKAVLEYEQDVDTAAAKVASLTDIERTRKSLVVDHFMKNSLSSYPENSEIHRNMTTWWGMGDSEKAYEYISDPENLLGQPTSLDNFPMGLAAKSSINTAVKKSSDDAYSHYVSTTVEASWRKENEIAPDAVLNTAQNFKWDKVKDDLIASPPPGVSEEASIRAAESAIETTTRLTQTAVSSHVSQNSEGQDIQRELGMETSPQEFTALTNKLYGKKAAGGSTEAIQQDFIIENNMTDVAALIEKELTESGQQLSPEELLETVPAMAAQRIQELISGQFIPMGRDAESWKAVYQSVMNQQSQMYRLDGLLDSYSNTITIPY